MKTEEMSAEKNLSCKEDIAIGENAFSKIIGGEEVRMKKIKNSSGYYEHLAQRNKYAVFFDRTMDSLLESDMYSDANKEIKGFWGDAKSNLDSVFNDNENNLKKESDKKDVAFSLGKIISNFENALDSFGLFLEESKKFLEVMEMEEALLLNGYENILGEYDDIEKEMVELKKNGHSEETNYIHLETSIAAISKTTKRIHEDIERVREKRVMVRNQVENFIPKHISDADLFLNELKNKKEKILSVSLDGQSLRTSEILVELENNFWRVMENVQKENIVRSQKLKNDREKNPDWAQRYHKVAKRSQEVRDNIVSINMDSLNDRNIIKEFQRDLRLVLGHHPELLTGDFSESDLKNSIKDFINFQDMLKKSYDKLKIKINEGDNNFDNKELGIKFRKAILAQFEEATASLNFIVINLSQIENNMISRDSNDRLAKLSEGAAQTSMLLKKSNEEAEVLKKIGKYDYYIGRACKTFSEVLSHELVRHVLFEYLIEDDISKIEEISEKEKIDFKSLYKMDSFADNNNQLILNKIILNKIITIGSKGAQSKDDFVGKLLKTFRRLPDNGNKKDLSIESVEALSSALETIWKFDIEDYQIDTILEDSGRSNDIKRYKSTWNKPRIEQINDSRYNFDARAGRMLKEKFDIKDWDDLLYDNAKVLDSNYENRDLVLLDNGLVFEYANNKIIPKKVLLKTYNGDGQHGETAMGVYEGEGIFKTDKVSLGMGSLKTHIRVNGNLSMDIPNIKNDILSFDDGSFVYVGFKGNIIEKKNFDKNLIDEKSLYKPDLKAIFTDNFVMMVDSEKLYKKDGLESFKIKGEDLYLVYAKNRDFWIYSESDFENGFLKTGNESEKNILRNDGSFVFNESSQDIDIIKTSEGVKFLRKVDNEWMFYGKDIEVFSSIFNIKPYFSEDYSTGNHTYFKRRDRDEIIDITNERVIYGSELKYNNNGDYYLVNKAGSWKKVSFDEDNKKENEVALDERISYISKDDFDINNIVKAVDGGGNKNFMRDSGKLIFGESKWFGKVKSYVENDQSFYVGLGRESAMIVDEHGNNIKRFGKESFLNLGGIFKKDSIMEDIKEIMNNAYTEKNIKFSYNGEKYIWDNDGIMEDNGGE